MRNTDSQKPTRRGFVKSTAAGMISAIGLPTIVSASSVGKADVVPPSDRIVMGCIGTGGMGLHDMRAFMGQPDVQVVAVCDVEIESNFYYGGTVAGREPARKMVDAHYARRKSGKGQGCAAYHDFQELLDRDDIDAVTVTTPDHWHALVSVAAAKSGKDIYCEKPLANSVGEGRAVCRAVEKHDRILQTGSHERSGNNARMVAELVRNGYLGKLSSIEINMPCNDPHHQQVRKCTGIPPALSVPRGFDFDRWLGPAAKASYTPQRCHFWWRFILAYGGGEMTDRGAHVIDLAQMIAGLDHTGPIRVSGKGINNEKSLYDSFFDYEFELTYANGLKMTGTSRGPRGLKIIGSEGWVFVHVHGGRLEAEPKSLLQQTIGDNQIRIGRSKSHHRNFLDSVKSREPAFAPAEAGHRTGSICHLVNIAMRLKRELKWDPVKEVVENDEAANQLLMPSMRSPWKI